MAREPVLFFGSPLQQGHQKLLQVYSMSAQDNEFSKRIDLIFEQFAAPMVMGILNITEDSFYDGGRYNSPDKWLPQAQKMIIEGADIIDIGAASSRPGAKPVETAKERDLMEAAVSSVRREFSGIIISADTWRADVAKAAASAGADIINDVSGGTLDDQMFDVVGKLNVAYVLMHIQGSPENMQDDPKYSDVTSELMDYFEIRRQMLRDAGCEKIILDPGFGFGKTLEHNYQLLSDLGEFADSGYPVMVGLSRKSMINKVLNISAKDALTGTSILNYQALINGASILRVHDVKEAVQVKKLYMHVHRHGQ
jgi:dihydropteroate synthase